VVVVIAMLAPMNWLHHKYGSPEAPDHNERHRRCARPAISAEGTPADLSSDRAAWLPFHLCRTGTLADAASLLHITWRNAYRAAASSDALYLAAMREIARHYAERLDALPANDEATRAQVTGWILKAALLHAQVSALVGETPQFVLIAQTLLGQPEAAAYQAGANPDHNEAGAALSAIALALRDRAALTREITDVMTSLALQLREPHASQTLVAFCQLLVPVDTDRAIAIAEQVPADEERALVLADIARSSAAAGADRSQWLFDRALATAEGLPDPLERPHVLARLATLLAPSDPDRALTIATKSRTRRL